ncbi:MAG: DUF429 domain-containing protein, partial [Acidimicrobiia bacterium]|nr:DUF429 domain-containing protein [Acidimicrobiia bacterium]
MTPWREAATSRSVIDCPLGWPQDFTDFVVRHERREIAAGEAELLESRQTLVSRATDVFICGELRSGGGVDDPPRRSGPRPLSVSSDLIGRTTMRAAGLLAQLAADGHCIDRSGQQGLVVEVYPAAALYRWKLAHNLYKTAKNRMALATLLDKLSRATEPWLTFDEGVRDRCART